MVLEKQARLTLVLGRPAGASRSQKERASREANNNAVLSTLVVPLHVYVRCMHAITGTVLVGAVLCADQF